MKKSSKYWIAIIGLLLCLPTYAQLPTNRIRPGTMYYAGDTVRSPRLGLSARIPEGWEGVMPRESEVFLLMSNTVNGEIYAVANENIDKQGQINRWKTGFEMADGLKLVPDGAITTRGDVICALAKMTGNKANVNYKVYVEAKCSPFGFCITYMMLTPDPASFEKVKNSLQSFVDFTSFSKPSNESPYVNFDWKKFLSGKVLLNIDYDKTSKREDEVSFCSDGTFTSNITRKGVFKAQSKDYKGNKKGTWEVKSKGEKATITFTIKNLEPVIIDLEIKEEDIYANGRRYFIGANEKCK